MQQREHNARSPAGSGSRHAAWAIPVAAGLACAVAVMLGQADASLQWLVALGGALAVAALTRLGMAQRPHAAPASAPAGPSGARLMIKTVVPVWQRQLETARSEADRELGELLHRFVALSDALDEAATTGLHQHLDQVYVGFQFQDRLGQMLESVTQDMQRFTALLVDHDRADTASARRWLEQLEHSYTMDEQRQPPAVPAHTSPATPATSSGVDYF